MGRVAAADEQRELPSGDQVCTFRLVVDRPPPALRSSRSAAGLPASASPEGRTRARTVPVDTLDCAGWTAGVRRTARGLAAGDVVQVSGALRRRFWRAGPATASRCEVEVTSLRRLVRATPGTAPVRGRRATRDRRSGPFDPSDPPNTPDTGAATGAVTGAPG